MFDTKRIHFLIACIVALSVFMAYQGIYGGDHNQAYASLSDDGVDGREARLVNYKPARKRLLSSRLRDDAENILDLKGHDIAQIFDAPELVRRELPTTIWQYRNEKCVMDVYFTVGRKGDVSRANVAHYEVRGRDTRAKKDIQVSDCVEDLVAHDSMISLIDVNAIFKAN